MKGRFDFDQAAPQLDGAVNHAATGCRIVADARIDNRPELLGKLALDASATDAEALLAAWLHWGEDCVRHLLGDFAFVVWDPRTRTLFCARDPMGLRLFAYHHAPGQRFIFGSTPREVRKAGGVPEALDEGRVMDFLVTELEFIDHTSTFFRDIKRLPPGHTLTVTAAGIKAQRYHELKAGPPLELGSDAEYAEAFIEVFTTAIRDRMRGAEGRFGSMLSGGLDSGTVVAVGRTLGPLPTFSGDGPDPPGWEESALLHATAEVTGAEATFVDYRNLGEYLPQLLAWSDDLDEPFDTWMNLPRAVFLAARDASVQVIAGGIGGDLMLSHSNHIVWLLRQRAFAKAWQEAGVSTWQSRMGALSSAARAAWMPRRLYQSLAARRRWGVFCRAKVAPMPVSERFVRKVDLHQRYLRYHKFQHDRPGSFHDQRMAAVLPNIVVGNERYARAAALAGLTFVDPFQDLRVIRFCSGLPVDQLTRGGWTKYLLRQATVGRLPEAVRWSRRKDHFGERFNHAVHTAVLRRYPDGGLDLVLGKLAPYVDADRVQKIWQDDNSETVYPRSALVAVARWFEYNLGGVE